MTDQQEAREYTQAEKDAAYTHWRLTGSLRRTAERHDIALGTMMRWSRVYGWVQRRHEEDSKDRAVALAHAGMRIVDEVDGWIDDLVDISRNGTKEDRTRLDAIRLGLGIAGLVPVVRSERMLTTAATQVLSRQSSTGLPTESGDQLASFLLPFLTGADSRSTEDQPSPPFGADVLIDAANVQPFDTTFTTNDSDTDDTE